MGLPLEIVERVPDDGDVVALKMREGSREKYYYFLITDKEGPNNLEEYSLGAATALAAAGTSWQEITDSQGRYHLEPENDRVLYQTFYGIHPSYAWVYRRYPTNEDLGSLLGTRAIGGQVGYISGVDSPIASPTALTELWTLEGTHPSFLGYHPRGEPSSVTVRMSFFVHKFSVNYLTAPTVEQMRAAKRKTMGGLKLMDAPQWLR